VTQVPEHVKKKYLARNQKENVGRDKSDGSLPINPHKIKRIPEDNTASPKKISV
jgi:hypothetical protein